MKSRKAGREKDTLRGFESWLYFIKELRSNCSLLTPDNNVAT
jgi:hypothetical protein